MSDKSRKYITELFRIVDTKSILVVMHTGKMKRLNCPFPVICIINVPPLKEGYKYHVEAVKMTLNLEDVFIINGRAYFIWCFKIVV